MFSQRTPVPSNRKIVEFLNKSQMNISVDSKWPKSPEIPSSIQVDISGFITIVLEILTFLGNLFPATAAFMVRSARHRTVTDYFIGTLAINDILSVVVPLTFGIPTLLLGYWVGDKLGCQLYQVCIFWFQINEMFLVTSMSFERYLALKMPVYYRKKVLKKIYRVKILIGILFFVALLVSSMPLMGLANNGLRIPLTFCPCILITKATSLQQRIYPVFMLLLGYSTLVTVFLCNFFVIKTLKVFKGRFQQRTLSNESTTRNKTVAFSKLVFVLGALFYLTWAPVMVLLTLNQLDQRVNELTALYALTSLTINSLLHPVVYGVFSVQFRQSYAKIVRAFFPSFIIQALYHHNSCQEQQFRSRFRQIKRECSQDKKASNVDTGKP